MEEHRLAVAISTTVCGCATGQSNYEYIERQLSLTYPIQRFFSIMRTMGAKTLVEETIPLEGLLAEEYEDLRSFNYWSSETAKRLSFWDESFSDKSGVDRLLDSNLLGYAIVKESGVVSVASDFFVFEACCSIDRFGQGVYPAPGYYSVRVGDKIFSVKGNLYCQQNGLTSKCSHVALRSLLSAALPERDYSVRAMNRMAGLTTAEEIQRGLDVTEIRKVITEAGLSYYDVYYESVEPGQKMTYKPGQLPCQAFLYSGVETGVGGLLGFQVRATKKPSRHIIPFFGHTFDPDMWAADAQSRYLHSKYKVPTYLSSEIWSDRFVGHDDNFGANITMPQYFISPNMLTYVMSVYDGGVSDTSGVFAEAEAVAWFYQALSPVLRNDNDWTRRLKDSASEGAPRIVLRSLLIDKKTYLEHLASLEDSEGHTEAEDAIENIQDVIPEKIWMIELSIHQLFQINRRKLGEMLFDARLLKAKDAREVKSVGVPFSLARVPSSYFKRVGNEIAPNYDEISSALSAHVSCYRRPGVVDFEMVRLPIFQSKPLRR